MSRVLGEMAYMQRGLCVDREFMQIIKPLLRHEEVQEMRKFTAHGNVDCLSHSLQVAYMAYRMGKKFNLDYEALARAGILHDFYLYDWHHKEGREGLHGLTHAQTALENANRIFEMDEREQDIIKWHMWPLNIGLPKFRESWIMMFADRYCTVMEVMGVAPLQMRLYQ